MRPEDAQDSAGESLEDLRRRVRERPSDARAVAALAQRLAAQGERSAARALLQSIIADPEARPAQAQLALLDEDEGNWEAAAAGWERLLADDIEDKTAWAHLDRIRQRMRPALAQPATAEQTLVEPEGVAWSRYELLREIGRGATSTVYLARDRTLGLPLALKVLHPSPGFSQDCQRFFAEARAIAGLRHPGVVAIYDLDPSTRTLVMEHLPGGSLRDHLAAARPAGFPPGRVVGLARSLLATLDHVHAAGVVHGDITPRNILFRDPEQPVLADFGSAHVLGNAPSELAGGTPIYLAPEQLAGEPSTPMTDLFSLGAVLWEALVGQPMRQHADLMAGRPRAHPLPDPIARLHPGLTALISALTESKPDLRLAGAKSGLG
jgi:hypothetical protein